MNFNLKNTMYAFVILACGAIIYGQYKATQTESEQLESINEQRRIELEQTQVELEERKQEEYTREAKRREDKMIDEYKSLRIRRDKLQAYLERDSRRIFRRIPKDSLLVYGAMIYDLSLKIRKMEDVFDANGIREDDDRFEGMRAM